MRKGISFRQGLLACCVAFFSFQGAAVADRLDDMISPVTNPVNFDDPRANTEARLIYIGHEIDDDFITQGGNINLYALQLRFAVDDHLAILATKDGYVDFNPDAVLQDEEGFANIAVGAKYAFHRDASAGDIISAGLMYEIPMGNTDVFQGEGDGFFRPFLTGATALTDEVSLMTAAGFRLPIDSEDSTFFDYDLHVDYRIDTSWGAVYPLAELNVVHVLDGGERLPIADEGLDLISFGASDADGKTIVTAGGGFRVRFSENLDWGAAYQVPLTSGRGSNIIDWRVTTDLIFSFSLS